MNQKEVLQKIKTEIHHFPQFLKTLLKKPLQFIDYKSSLDWMQILIYCFLVEAGTQVFFHLSILNFSALLGSLIFYPLQMLVVIGFISFVIWFLLDRFGRTDISMLDIFKGLAFIEIIVSLLALPVLIISSYLKIFEVTYIVHTLIIIVKAYLLYRVLSRQFRFAQKASLGFSAGLALLFLLPHVSDFIEQYEDRVQARSRTSHEDQIMEESIRAIEEEFSNKED